MPPHYRRWREQGRPDLERFVATTDPTTSGRRPLVACSVPGCGSGRVTHGLCATHGRRWTYAGRPDLAAWVATLPPMADRPRRTCRLSYCALWAQGNGPLCKGHAARWRQLGRPDGEVPAFSDARAEELLAEARRRGLRPRSHAELLPLLLDLLGGCTPVEQWPTQRARSSPAKQRPETKRRRTARAREAAQTAAAAHDRPRQAKDPTGAAGVANVVPLDLDQHAGQVQDAIDAERRRRREAAVPRRPDPPPRLGEAFRRRSLFILPDEDPGRGEGDEPDQIGTPEQAP